MAQSITDFTISDSNEKNPLDLQSTNNYKAIDSVPPNFTEQKVDENNVELEDSKQFLEHSVKVSLSEDISHITSSSSESKSVSINIGSTETESSSNEQDFKSNSQEVNNVLNECNQDICNEIVLHNTENDILDEHLPICETPEENSSSEDLSETPEGNSSSEPVTPDHQKNWDEERQNFIRITEYVKELETRNAGLESEISEMKLRLSHQELTFKEAELKMRAEFLNNVEKLSKECNILRKEKEAIVIRYANSEKEVIKEKKVQQELEKRIKDLNKERDNLLSKIKGLSSENNRLSSCYESKKVKDLKKNETKPQKQKVLEKEIDFLQKHIYQTSEEAKYLANEVEKSKMVEIAKLQKNFDKLNADFNSREIRIKWLQNKLKTETGSHQETQTKLEHTLHRLNEMKEEAEQVRKDCQEMIKCYQEGEEIKSVKLDSQLKQKLSELEVQKQEKSDQDQVYQLLRQELEALKRKQRMTLEENNTLTLKIQSLEKERLEYEQNLSKLKDSQNMSKQEISDLTARLAEMETLRLQLEREKEKSAASLREIERLRLTNAELQADMNACHIKEGELLKFTEGVTDTNVKLQSAHSLLEVKAQALEDEMAETKKILTDLQQKHAHLVNEMETLKKEHEEEVQLLARKLAEKTKNVEKLNTKLDEAENENRVLKRRHIASIKELSRELHECKRRLDKYESTNGIRTESASLGSRSSSTTSLDVVNSNDGRINSISPSPSVANHSNKVTSNPTPEATSSDIPGIDKEMLIERIIKLQKTLARKNDKIDFLEDHIVQLVKEMRKKIQVC